MRKNYISLRGITRKDVLLLVCSRRSSRDTLRRRCSPSPDVLQRRGDRAAPLLDTAALLSQARREDRNRLDACLPFSSCASARTGCRCSCSIRVDLGRPSDLRRLNRLDQGRGALEIIRRRTRCRRSWTSRGPRASPFLEETCIVSLCQLLSRSVDRAVARVLQRPGRNARSLNGYVRGARFIPGEDHDRPARRHLLVRRSSTRGTRALAVESIERMDLSGREEPAAAAEDLRHRGRSTRA